MLRFVRQLDEETLEMFMTATPRKLVWMVRKVRDEIHRLSAQESN